MTENRSREDTSTDVIDVVSMWVVGLGTITLALFPLALPILALTAVAVVPLLLVGLAGALAFVAIAAPILLIWAGARSAIRALRPTPATTGPAHPGASS